MNSWGSRVSRYVTDWYHRNNLVVDGDEYFTPYTLCSWSLVKLIFGRFLSLNANNFLNIIILMFILFLRKENNEFTNYKWEASFYWNTISLLIHFVVNIRTINLLLKIMLEKTFPFEIMGKWISTEFIIPPLHIFAQQLMINCYFVLHNTREIMSNKPNVFCNT